MSVELREVGGSVQLWVTHPVDVTIVQAGRGRNRRAPKAEASLVSAKVKRFSKPLLTPNGKPRFLSAILGLPVTRYLPHYDTHGRGAIFVTPGGTVLRLTARAEPFSEDLDYLADALGLYHHIRLEHADAADVARELSHRFGFPIQVTVATTGEVAVTGSSQMSAEQKEYVREFLNAWRRK